MALRQNQTNSNNMSGEGVIDKVIRQGHKWRVRTNGSYWFAQSTAPADFQPGDHVRIVGRRKTTLLVDPA